MVERWAVERAIRDSTCSLAPPGRHLVLTLLTWTDNGTAVIPPQYSPSLTDLERATGMARSTITVWLNRLEESGWVKRHRPKVADARRLKARTTYRLQVPPVKSRPAANKHLDRLPDREPGTSSSPPAGPTLVRQPTRASSQDAPGSHPEQDPPIRATKPIDASHRYVPGANGYCSYTGCGRSAPLHAA